MIEFWELFNPIPPMVFCGCLGIRMGGVKEGGDGGGGGGADCKLYQLLYN